MSDLRDLYQEVILDHYKHPRNRGTLAHCSKSADGFNPLCGDRITVELETDGERITDIRFEGSGCAISMASASMMTEAVKGLTESEAHQIFADFRRLVTGEAEPEDVDLGKLAVFAGVRDYPTRVKCATLTWHTLANAIAGRAENARTE
jgi:nitrogen fixation NifU-like protein